MPPQKTKPKKQMPPPKKSPKGKVKFALPAEEDSSEDDEEDDEEDDSEGEQIQIMKGGKQKMKVQANSVGEDDSEEDEEDDDDELDIDEGDSDDFDEDMDDEEIDMDEEDFDEDEDEEDDEEIEAQIQQLKKNAMNGKDAKKTTTEKKAAVVEETKKEKEKPEAKHESREKAVGPVTAEEKELFSKSFRAMSATSVFVAKLPEDATNEDLKKLHPAILSIRRPTSRKGVLATFAFLNFSNKETADRALKEISKKGPVKIRGKEVMTNSNGSGECHPPSVVDRRKLKIYGCPKHITKEAIKAAMPGCVDVLLGERDKGNAVEAVAVFKTSAETKKILLTKPTVTLNECVCALFYLNISHSVKQNERKNNRKQALKKQKAEEKAKNNKENEDAEDDDNEDDDDDDEDDDDDDEVSAPVVQKGKKSSLKPAPSPKPKKSSLKPAPTPKGKKRPAPEDSDDEEEVEIKTPAKGKKVSMKSPKTPVGKQMSAKKSPRKGTPFQKRAKV